MCSARADWAGGRVGDETGARRRRSDDSARGGTAGGADRRGAGVEGVKTTMEDGEESA